MIKNKALSYFFILFTLSIWGIGNVNARDNLVLGVFPYMTASQLMQLQMPLKLCLEEHLGKTVSMVTAPDFQTFVQRTQANEYDFILTAPHLGWLAESRDHYQFIVATDHSVQGVFLARADSGIRSLDDLEGRTVAMAAPVSLLFQMGLEELRQHGYSDNKNISIKVARTHNNAMYAPVRREADVSITGSLIWEKFGDQFKDEMRVIGRTPKLSGLTMLANGSVSTKENQLVEKALLAFAESSEGENYFKKTGFGKFMKVDKEKRSSMERFVGFAKK